MLTLPVTPRTFGFMVLRCSADRHAGSFGLHAMLAEPENIAHPFGIR